MCQCAATRAFRLLSLACASTAPPTATSVPLPHCPRCCVPSCCAASRRRWPQSYPRRWSTCFPVSNGVLLVVQRRHLHCGMVRCVRQHKVEYLDQLPGEWARELSVCGVAAAASLGGGWDGVVQRGASREHPQRCRTRGLDPLLLAGVILVAGASSVPPAAPPAAYPLLFFPPLALTPSPGALQCCPAPTSRRCSS